MIQFELVWLLWLEDLKELPYFDIWRLCVCHDSTRTFWAEELTHSAAVKPGKCRCSEYQEGVRPERLHLAVRYNIHPAQHIITLRAMCMPYKATGSLWAYLYRNQKSSCHWHLDSWELSSKQGIRERTSTLAFQTPKPSGPIPAGKPAHPEKNSRAGCSVVGPRNYNHASQMWANVGSRRRHLILVFHVAFFMRILFCGDSEPRVSSSGSYSS